MGAAELSANASSDTGNGAVTQGMSSVCLVLLLLSAAAEGTLGNVGKLLWLLSLMSLTVMNPAAGLGIYVASVAIYSAPYVYGMESQASRFGSVFERPDNFALGFLFLMFGMFHFRLRFLLRSWRLALLILMFLLTTFIHAAALGLMTRTNFALFMRMFGFPLILFLLIVGSPVSIRHMRAFFATVMALTVYLALISILEGLDLRSFIIPTWVADPVLNQTIGTDRSGGVFLQSEWNGFALCLGYCTIAGLLLMNKQRHGSLKYAAVLLCLAAIYFTYTRAAWLAAAAASLLLLLRSPQHDHLHLKRILSIALIGIATLVLIFFSGSTAKERTGDADTAYFRINLWMAGVQMAMSRPILGHGFGQFKEGVVQYHEDTGLVPFTALSSEGMVAHNTLVNILVEQGSLGLLLYLIIFIQIYLRARRASIALSPKSGQIWVTAFTLVYIINTQFIVAYEPTTNFIYYGAMGFLIGTENDAPTHR